MKINEIILPDNTDCEMEAAGVVGPFEGSKARQVLINDLASLNRLFDDEKL